MAPEDTERPTPITKGQQEKLLFEGILNDFRIDNGQSSKSIRRGLNDYYFDIIEMFNLETLLVGKVLNNGQDVIIFGAVTKAGQTMDIHYHNGKVELVTEFTPEMTEAKSVFLRADAYRNSLHDERFNSGREQGTDPARAAFSDIDNGLAGLSKCEEDYNIASRNLIQLYTAGL